MKRHIISLLLASVVLTVSCTREIESSISLDPIITVEATNIEPDFTRTTLQDNGIKVYWEPQDEIAVFYNGSCGRFVSQNEEPALTAKFEGTLNAILGFNEGEAAENPIWGLYPYREDASSDKLSVTTVLPAEQIGRAGSFARNTQITLARANSLSLGFFNVTGGLRFYLSQEGINAVSFEGANGEILAGTIKLAFENGVPVVQEVTEGKTRITLTAPDGDSFQTGQWYYLAAIPGALANGFKMTFYKDNGYAVFTSDKAVSFKRGIFGSLTAPDAGLEWVNLDYVYIPDPVFREYMISHFDTNGDGYLGFDEAGDVTKISVITDNIYSLRGIEYCKNLTYLRCAGKGLLVNYDDFSHISMGHLTALDISRNVALTTLDCYGNQITSLDVSNNEKLQEFNCIGNYLTSLDVRKNTALKRLDCGGNYLTTIDLSQNTYLSFLDVGWNQLSSLDVKQNTALTHLICDSNQITNIDLSANTALKELVCYYNQLVNLDVRNNTLLTHLDCFGNRLEELDVRHNKELRSLYCYDNLLRSLDVSENLSLEWLYCSPMNDSAGKNLLDCLYISEGQSIPYITTDRSEDRIPAGTVITIIPDGNDVPVVGVINNLNQLVSFINGTSDSEVEVWNLEADIDCLGETFLPVPEFSAVFDGKNHKIYNYHVESEGVSSGFFKNVSGTIKNIAFGTSDGVNWDGLSTVGYITSATTGHTGGVCAELSGTLENVKSFAKIAVELNNSSIAGIGGLVGLADSPAAILTSENCAAITVSGFMQDLVYIGGIVGSAKGDNILIENCLNSAPLSIGMVNTKAMMLGGIAGRMERGSVVDNCRNTMAVKYNQNTSETGGTYILIAGIAGGVYSNSVVKNCTNTGDISSNRNQGNRIGGIVGTLYNTGLVENNVNYGEIAINQENANNNWQAAGGIVGFQERASNGNVIRNNTNYGSVTVNVENATSHQNKVSAGGVIGLGVLGLEVSGNINNGAVSLTNRGVGASYAGGIIGWFRGTGSISMNNENKASVFCKSEDDVDAMAGGIAGYISDTCITLSIDKNIGPVSCGNASHSGAIAGVNSGTLSSCVAGGSVNGKVLTEMNYLELLQGSASSGTVIGATLAL